MTVYPDSVTVEIGTFGGATNVLGTPIEEQAGGLTWKTHPLIHPDGDYMFVVSSTNFAQINVYDISSPGAITLDNTFALSTQVTNDAVQWGAFNAAAGWLYIHDGKDQLYPVDINPIGSPSVGTAITVSDATTSGRYALVRSGTTLYGAAIEDDEDIDVIDISTPSTPSLSSSHSMAAALSSAALDFMALSPDGNHLFIGAWVANTALVGVGVVDVSGTPTQESGITFPTSVNGAVSSIGPPMFINDTLVVPVTDGVGTFWLTYTASAGPDWGNTSLASHASGTIDPGVPSTSVGGGSPLIPEAARLQSVDSFDDVIYVSYDAVGTGPGYFTTYIISGASAGDIPDQVGQIPFPTDVDVQVKALSFAPGGEAAVFASPIAGGAFTREVLFVVQALDATAAFTDITSYVCQTPGISIRYGIDGTGPQDRVASTGTCSFELENIETLGLWSPDHASVHAQFREGAQVRVSIGYNSNVWRWFGWIDDIRPQLGQYLAPRTAVTAVDAMDALARSKAQGIGLLTDVSPETVFSVLLSFARPLPNGYVVSASGETYPYAFDRALQEEFAIASEMQALATSERGQIYVEQGVMHFDGREVRAQKYSSALSKAFTEDDLHVVSVSRGKSVLYNRARAMVYPRKADGSDVVLFTLEGDPPRIEKNQTLEFTAQYVDPDQLASRVGAISVVTPVASTDYTFERASGKDLTAALDVDVEIGANSSDVVLTNTGGKPARVTLFQLRGKGLYSYEPVEAVAENEASIAKYGLNEIVYDMEYQTDSEAARLAAEDIVGTYGTPRTIVDALTVVANNSSALLEDVVDGTLAIGNRISVSETVSGLSGAEYFIQNVAVSITSGDVIRATYGLAPAEFDQVWVLGDVERGVLDETTYLTSGFVV